MRAATGGEARWRASVVRPVLPLPWCACRESAPRPWSGLRSAFGACDPECGIVTDITLGAGPDGAVIAHAAGGPVGAASGIEGLAADRQTERAIRRALHEALERYALFAVPPRSRRGRARRFVDGASCAVPEHEIWIGVDGHAGCSDGAAVDADPARARHRAVLERLERVAVADALAGRTRPARIEGGAHAGMVVLPSPAAWVVMAYARTDTMPFCALGLGTGAALGPSRRSALNELSLVRAVFGSSAARAAAGAVPVGSPHDVLFARAAFEADLPAPLAEWLGRVRSVDTARTIDVDAALRDAFPAAWWADVTPPDLVDLGLSAMRAGLG